MLTSFFMAFSLYSRIPVPQTEWNEKSMRWCICFLPAVGAAIGAAQGLLYWLLAHLSVGAVFRGAALTALPVLLSGGIHLDGFLDTCDVIHSYGTREKRLEILKDPHVGAFAVIGGLVWFTLQLGVWSEAQNRTIVPLCITFALSRSLSAFSALVFPKAKKDGMLRQETDPAAKSSAAAMAAVSLLLASAMIYTGALPGAAAVLTAVLTLALYYRMAVTVFGGITGDLSGWFTQMCELVTGGTIVIAAAILR